MLGTCFTSQAKAECISSWACWVFFPSKGPNLVPSEILCLAQIPEYLENKLVGIHNKSKQELFDVLFNSRQRLTFYGIIIYH